MGRLQGMWVATTAMIYSFSEPESLTIGSFLLSRGFWQHSKPHLHHDQLHGPPPPMHVRGIAHQDTVALLLLR